MFFQVLKISHTTLKECKEGDRQSISVDCLWSVPPDLSQPKAGVGGEHWPNLCTEYTIRIAAL